MQCIEVQLYTLYIKSNYTFYYSFINSKTGQKNTPDINVLRGTKVNHTEIRILAELGVSAI
ncbi:MAG: hypothetical protein VR67_08645 [Peptococcaceae bacterium BRH_c8a]|nr:MAG: hypothetical protein VR67_08645 [Peptococcaceae bacterium BRH_c8a]